MLACQLQVVQAQTAPLQPSTSASATADRLPEQGAWKSIFEANAKKGEDGKVERKGWSEEMKDAWREWKVTSNQNLAKVLESKLEELKQLDAKVESLDQVNQKKIDVNLSKEVIDEQL